MSLSGYRKHEDIIQFTNKVVATIRNIAESVQVPFLGPIASLTLAISETVQSMNTYREEATRMIEHIHGILCAILKLYATSETGGVIPPNLLYDIAKFAETLQKIYTFVDHQRHMGKFKRLFRQFDSRTQLETCKAELENAVERFHVETGIASVAQMADIKRETREKHAEMAELLKTYPYLASSSRSSESTPSASLFSFVNTAGSVSLLPAAPQIFYGREEEVEQIINALTLGPARIAILGAGGIGKTSLAIAALHHPVVAARYANKYFITCATTSTYDELVSSIAAAVQVENGQNVIKKLVQHFSFSPPTALVLDNFETPWEPTSTRTDVEEFLSLLTETENIALIVTMRGTERPGGVKWTRPFLLPLKPLENWAARRAFIDIADDFHVEEKVSQLLALTANLPLAVNLMASVVAYEGCDATLLRWKSESTHILSEGYDKRSSLDISITMSFMSSRMTPSAQELLRLLSILPDGLSDADLLQSNLPISNILSCKATLIRISLAYTDHAGRLKVLVPIREHIHSRYPPLPAHIFAIRQYFHKLLALWESFERLPSGAMQISQHLENFNRILPNGLHSDVDDIATTVKSIVYLNKFSRYRNYGYSPLMAVLAEKIFVVGDPELQGIYLVEVFFSTREAKVVNATELINRGNQIFEHQDVDAQRKAEWYGAVGIYHQHQRSDMIEASRFHQLALSIAKTANQLPTRISQIALFGFASAQSWLGRFLDSQKLAQQLQNNYILLGDIPGQANALRFEAWCCLSLGDLQHAAYLCTQSRELITACGLQDGDIDLRLRSIEAEVHFLKTEYAEGRSIHASFVNSVSVDQKRTYNASGALLNIGFIDCATGVDREAVCQSLDAAKLNFSTFLHLPIGVTMCEQGYAHLHLRDGNLSAARSTFEKCLSSYRGVLVEGVLNCLETLADFNLRMSSSKEALGWAAIYLATAQKTKNKLALHKSLRCFAVLFSAENDDETASSLLELALDGFTFMGIHRSRGDCMVHMAAICERRGEIHRSIGLWKAALPLFERSLQGKDVALVNDKLALSGLASM